MAKVVTKKVERVAPDAAIVLVLQWLTYALWGMFVGSLMWLAGVVFAAVFINSYATVPGDLLAFSLSATLVSLLLASLADYFYSRYEPESKTGVARVVMLVHVVLFTLAGVGLVIAIAYNLLSSLVGAGGDTDARTAFVLTTLVGVVALAVLVVRIVMPFKRAWLRKAAVIAMVVLGLGFVIAALVGPAAEARLAAEDKVLEDGVEVIASEINKYTSNEDKLPGALSDLDLGANLTKRTTGDRYDNAKKAISEGLVKYTPNTKPPTGGRGEVFFDDKVEPDSGASSTIAPYKPNGKVFYYKLCVDYKTDKSKRNGGYNYPQSLSKGGVVVPDTFRHDKGEECYDLQTGYAY